MKPIAFFIVIFFTCVFFNVNAQGVRHGQYMGVPSNGVPRLTNMSDYIQYIPKKDNSETSIRNNNFQYKNGTPYHNQISNYFAQVAVKITDTKEQSDFYNFRLQFESYKEMQLNLLNNQFFQINKASWNSHYLSNDGDKYFDIRELTNLNSTERLLVENYISTKQTPMISITECEALFPQLNDFPSYLTINEVYYIALDYTGLTNDYLPTVLSIYLQYQGS